MSVKDQLEQSHIDGSHTTVKTKRAKKPVMTEFDRNLAWQQETYGEYEVRFKNIIMCCVNLIYRYLCVNRAVIPR